MNVAKLEAARDAARDSALGHANRGEVRAVTDRIVALKAKETLTEREASELQAAVTTRAKLQAETFAPVAAAQLELTSTRRAIRAAEDRSAADAFAALSLEELEVKGAELTATRKGLKRQQRALTIALSRKREEAEAAALIAKLTPEQRAQLKHALS